MDVNAIYFNSLELVLPKKRTCKPASSNIPKANSIIQNKIQMYFTVMNTYIRTSHCVPTTIVRTLKRKNKTRKQTYQNYLYIQSANFEMLFSCAVYALYYWLEGRVKPKPVPRPGQGSSL